MESSSVDQDQFVITVAVVDPVIKDGMSKYILYTVRGEDRNGQFEVFRRYSDFYAVRSILVQRWPACFIPAIPPKKAVGNMDQQFIEDRRKFLENFCKQISSIKYLWYSEEFNIFLRSTQHDIEKPLNNLPKQNFQTIIQKYQETFKHLQGKDLSNEITMKIATFTAYLKKVKPMLENYKQMTKNIIKQNQEHNKEYGNFINFLLPQYETNCISEYLNNAIEGKLIFSEQNNQEFNQYIGQVKDLIKSCEIQTIYEMLKLELIEIEAFLEALQEREKYEVLKKQSDNKLKDNQMELQKVMAGKTTFKSMFSSKTKEDSIQQITNQLESKEKELKYYQVLKQLATFEVQSNKLKQDFWTFIQDNKNLN